MTALDEQRETDAFMRGFNGGLEIQKQLTVVLLKRAARDLACAEPARMIGEPCSCAAGLARAIEIVEGMR